jgi:hypothetical protein
MGTALIGRLCELRKQQPEAWRDNQARQLALFELKDDRRPAPERSATGRYESPTMFDLMRGAE